MVLATAGEQMAMSALQWARLLIPTYCLY